MCPRVLCWVQSRRGTDGTDGTAQTAALLRWDSTTGSYPSFPRQVTRHSLKLWEEAVKIMG